MRCRVLAVTVLLAVGCGSTTRYVNVPELVPPGRTTSPSAAEAEIEEMLRKVAVAPVTAEYFGRLFQSAVIVMKDLDDATFTVQIAKGTVTLTRGSHIAKPDLVIPIRRDAVENLLRIISDGKVDAAEGYTINVATHVPGLRRLFRNPALYDEAVAGALGLPPLIHTTLQNPGAETSATATVANVAGQWLVFEGHVGAPLLTLVFTEERANELTRLVFEPLPPGADDEAKLARVVEIRRLVNSVTVQPKDAGTE